MEVQGEHHEDVELLTGERFTILTSKTLESLVEEARQFKASHDELKVLDILFTARRDENGEDELAAVITYEEDIG